MHRFALAGLTLTGLLALFFVATRPTPTPARTHPPARSMQANPPLPARRVHAPPVIAAAVPEQADIVETPPVTPSDEKPALVAKILRDYDDLRQGLVQAYAREAESYPGGSDALLRLLALLEREKHADLARILTARELAGLEWRDTRAGRRVERTLSRTGATEEQQHAVFRIERDFELRHGQPAEPGAKALGEREQARRTADEQIRAVLGAALYARWVAPPAGAGARSEGGG